MFGNLLRFAAYEDEIFAYVFFQLFPRVLERHSNKNVAATHLLLAPFGTDLFRYASDGTEWYLTNAIAGRLPLDLNIFYDGSPLFFHITELSYWDLLFDGAPDSLFDIWKLNAEGQTVLDFLLRNKIYTYQVCCRLCCYIPLWQCENYKVIADMAASRSVELAVVEVLYHFDGEKYSSYNSLSASGNIARDIAVSLVEAFARLGHWEMFQKFVAMTQIPPTPPTEGKGQGKIPLDLKELLDLALIASLEEGNDNVTKLIITDTSFSGIVEPLIKSTELVSSKNGSTKNNIIHFLRTSCAFKLLVPKLDFNSLALERNSDGDLPIHRWALSSISMASFILKLPGLEDHLISSKNKKGLTPIALIPPPDGISGLKTALEAYCPTSRLKLEDRRKMRRIRRIQAMIDEWVAQNRPD